MSTEYLDHPEAYLWVRENDRLTPIDRDRLYDLKHGAKPEKPIEEILVKNPDWLRIYLRHLIGESVIEINPTEPLPVWDKAHFEALEMMKYDLGETLLDRLENSIIAQLGVRVGDLIADGKYPEAETLLNYSVNFCYEVAEEGLRFAVIDPGSVRDKQDD